MRTIAKRNLILLSALLFLIFCVFPASASAAVRQTDVSTASSGCSLVNVPGQFAQADVSTILAQVNSYRREACENGYPNPSDPSVKLTMADYSEVQWSGDLEWIAQTRAAEGCLYQSHTRTNGKSCFSIEHNGVRSFSETLAWNYGSLTGGISQWYAEKDDWIAQNSSAVTGHYTAMIKPSVRYIGIGCFTSGSGGWSCVAGEYSSEKGLSTSVQGVYGECAQILEVPSPCISSLSISGDSSVVIEKTAVYSPYQTVSFPGIIGGTVETPITPSGTASWTSSSPQTASISSDGVLSANAAGTAVITLSYPDGSSASKSVTVVRPPKDTTITLDGTEYKVTNASGEVSYSKSSSSGSSAVIPDAIDYRGFSYKVTSIANNAFKNNKTLKSIEIGSSVKTIGKNAFYGCTALKSVTIPANVTSIGKKAFFKCKKLKTLTIKSKKLKAGKVGGSAFSKTGIKKVNVPKSKKKAYKKWLYNKGISRKAAIK